MSHPIERIERRRFLSQIAALAPTVWGLPACVSEFRSSFAGGSSRERGFSSRVIFADPATVKELAALAHEELGRVDNGGWVACPDRTLRILAERHPPMFLYFDRREYDLAVNGMSRTQVQEVIRRRRDHWAPQAMGHVLSRLFDIERVRLEGALRVSGYQGPGISPGVENSLTLLQRLAGMDRYKMVPAMALAFTVLEGESLLLATIRSAVAAAVAGKTQALSTHLDRRLVWTKAIAQVLTALGAPQHANALPYADPARGVFVHPADEDFQRQVLGSGEPAVRWRNGVVYVSAERRFSEQRDRGRSVQTLYADAGEFYESVDTLTTAQLQRDFARRLARPAAETSRDRLSEIDRLHLHQILLKCELRGRSEAARACQSAGFDTLMREEVQLLGRSLSHTQSFSRSQGLESVKPGTLFRAAQDAGTADLSLFTAIAVRHWPSIAQILKQIRY